MEDKAKLVLVLDGHDGTGKTTLAKRLASELEATYLQPFHGSGGVQLIELVEQDQLVFAGRLAQRLVKGALAGAKTSTVICDRHWMTLYTLLPAHYWPEWEPLPPTVLCQAELATIRQRLAGRDEKQFGASYHRYYLEYYQKLARQYECPVLHTDQHSVKECLNWLLDWAKNQ
jgi:thymidylate kinase